jgi:hypothetical protein
MLNNKGMEIVRQKNSRQIFTEAINRSYTFVASADLSPHCPGILSKQTIIFEQEHWVFFPVLLSAVGN